MEETHKKPLTMGQKIERIRTFRGVKQEYLALKLGISQQQVSKIEQQEEIEENLLKDIADILGVTPEVIKNFDEDKITYVINHQYNIYNTEIKDNATNNFVFNPIEKVAELYERLLSSEREKNDLLRK
jgi:transcriptional regulator with XRE-family HTH domain